MRRIQLLDLIRANADRQLSEVRHEAKADGVYIYVSGVIDADFGVSAAAIAAIMHSLPADQPVTMIINSPGGDVFEATAIASIIARHRGPVTARIEGAALSAATRVAMAASRIEMADSGMWMIHDSWTIAIGNKADMRETAALLEKIDATIAADYVAKTGRSVEEITAWMAAETWFTAAEAKDAGFVDEVFATTQRNRAWDLSAYANAPRSKDDAATLNESMQAARDTAQRRLRLLQIA